MLKLLERILDDKKRAVVEGEFCERKQDGLVKVEELIMVHLP